MMTVDYARTMAAYNRWMNERLYQTCLTLGDVERKADRKAFFHSVHGTLNHILLADRIWLGRFTGVPFKAKGLDDELFGDFAELWDARRETDAAIDDWVADLTDETLNSTLSYTSLVNPEPKQYPMALVVMHFFNHQTHHRGQVTTLLNQAGKDMGVTDLMWLPHALTASMNG